MSEDVSPALRTEMPHLIANEAAAKFAARERAATAPKSSPRSEGLSGFPRRVAQHDGSVLDARGGSEAPRLMERCFGDVRSAAVDRGSEPALMKTDQPDVVASARHSVRAQSEMHKLRERENSSPPLEELAAAAMKASQFD
ncbi:unnamed protein product [Strongylus vulgaris]|uniref:Uncharacterized protein n=1 Tax=Strongylus vulgaris TaxID=40348 RepID=A0A3P7LHM4_STRVU|nr:unnamed protein product [Strongylus vulgaris]